MWPDDGTHAASLAVSMSPMAKKRGWKQWYFGSKNVELKRFCGGRLTRGPFICIHILIGIVLILVIVIPIITAVVIPRMIQNRFKDALQTHGNTSRTSITVTNLAAGEFNFTTPFAAVSILPGTVEIKVPFVFDLSDENGKHWANITVTNSIEFPMNSDTNVMIPAKLNVYDTPSSSVLTSFLETKIIATTVETAWTINIWGFTWYHELPLNAVYSITFKKSLQEKFASIFTSNPASNTSFSMVDHGTNNIELNTTILPISTFPGIVEMVPPTVVTIGSVQGESWANFTFDAITFLLCQSSRISVDGKFNFIKMPNADFIGQVLIGKNASMHISSNLTIKIFGYQWYSNLPLQSTVVVDPTTAKSLLNGFIKMAMLAAFRRSTIRNASFSTHTATFWSFPCPICNRKKAGDVLTCSVKCEDALKKDHSGLYVKLMTLQEDAQAINMPELQIAMKKLSTRLTLLDCATWEDFLEINAVDIKNAAGIRLLSAAFSYVMTLRYHLPALGVNENDRSQVFMLGARAEATMPKHMWNHLNPYRLHIKMVGNHVPVIRKLPPESPNDAVHVSFESKLYHELPTSTTTPDAIVLFNPGLGHPHLKNLWAPSLNLALTTYKPLLITCFSAKDLHRDLEALDNAAESLDGTLNFTKTAGINPFQSRKIIVDPLDPQNPIQTNQYSMVVRLEE
ncbi:hypothetical protein THRCLA_02129 [Thraustotheca clavata]|uniref:Mitochondrial splicing suppressor 51-like C-terminal domain-containing protein n=1 Tax=Thraustotheca clavata TaxID=74557 RepID=A0A1W0A663_9STRA|nr:hypothetical protein THRCLA_02129 [Thraustotheca clavata]